MTGELFLTLPGHSGGVKTVVSIANTEYIVSGSDSNSGADQKIKI